MSLFIGNLAFKKENLADPTMLDVPTEVAEVQPETAASEAPNYDAALKIGVIGGSILSGIVGFIFLATSLPSPNHREEEEEVVVEETA